MKTLLTLSLLFLANCSFAQFEFTDINISGNYKGPKVKTLAIYYFETESDSTLTAINSYDSLGGWLTTKMFLKDATVASIDTCIYDENHYLVKRLKLEGNNIKYEVTNSNDAHGRLIHSKTIGESIYYETVSTYDEKGFLVKRQTQFGNSDTTYMSFLYNSLGLNIETTSFNKQSGKSITTREYNALGKPTKIKDVRRGSESLTELKYTNNNLSESTITRISNNKETTDKQIYTHYPNGLIFERIMAVNGKAITMEKVFYTFY